MRGEVKPKNPTLLKGLNSPKFVILSKKKMINHDTMLLTLKFPGENLELGLDIGRHIRVFGKDKEGNQI